MYLSVSSQKRKFFFFEIIFDYPILYHLEKYLDSTTALNEIKNQTVVQIVFLLAIYKK